MWKTRLRRMFGTQEYFTLNDVKEHFHCTRPQRMLNNLVCRKILERKNIPLKEMFPHKKPYDNKTMNVYVFIEIINKKDNRHYTFSTTNSIQST